MAVDNIRPAFLHELILISRVKYIIRGSTHHFVVDKQHNRREKLILVHAPSLLNESSKSLYSLVMEPIALLSIFYTAEFKMGARECVYCVHDRGTAV